MSCRTSILFPVETINRELDYRLVLACSAATAKNQVFIGQADVIYDLATRTRGGLYVGKHIFQRLFPGTSLDRYKQLKQNKITLVHLDEEGAVYTGTEEDWKRALSRRLDPTCLTPEDYICTWGSYQAAYYGSLIPDSRERVRVTGHPRFDLYGQVYKKLYQPAVDRIRERLGDFLLINTNVAFANNGGGISDSFNSPNYGFDPANQEDRLYSFRRWAHLTRVLANFVLLANRLSSEFPDMNVVIRPHPSEDHSFYAKVFARVPNVHVLHEGAVAPWLMASRMLIHDGCTTAIEAHLAGVPIVNYKSVDDQSFDLPLPNRFGIRCETEDQVVEAAAGLLEGKLRTDAPDLSGLPTALMSNFAEPALPRFKAVMAEAEQAQQAVAPSNPGRAAIQVSESVRAVQDRARAVVRPFFPRKQAQYRYSRQNHFYGLYEAAVSDKMRVIQEMLQKSVRWTVFGDNLMVVEGEEN